MRPGDRDGPVVAATRSRSSSRRVVSAYHGTASRRRGPRYAAPVTLLLLALAIASEVTATVSLKLSDGFSKLIPSIVVVIGYGAAFYFLSQALTRGMAIGVAYGIWSAVGVAAIAIIGVLFLDERLTLVQIGGIGLVILGVLALELGGAH
ncbi:DMT family transporter [Nocardia sp. GCM10030253]|uniref:DMT family transporter n=1 Tax=Nocardia sp. GCM10030253 TaxID=3273404 RepID=UPI0036385793